LHLSIYSLVPTTSQIGSIADFDTATRPQRIVSFLTHCARPRPSWRCTLCTPSNTTIRPMGRACPIILTYPASSPPPCLLAVSETWPIASDILSASSAEDLPLSSIASAATATPLKRRQSMVMTAIAYCIQQTRVNDCVHVAFMSSVTEGYILNPEASTCACHPIQSVSNLSASMHAITLPSVPCPPAISFQRLPSNSRKEPPATQERIAEPMHSLESWPSVSHPACITSRLLVDGATCHIALLDDGAQMHRRERDFERTGLDHPGGYTRLVSENFTDVHSTCISSALPYPQAETADLVFIPPISCTQHAMCFMSSFPFAHCIPTLQAPTTATPQPRHKHDVPLASVSKAAIG
jgi:hypothetical protein